MASNAVQSESKKQTGFLHPSVFAGSHGRLYSCKYAGLGRHGIRRQSFSQETKRRNYNGKGSSRSQLGR